MPAYRVYKIKNNQHRGRTRLHRQPATAIEKRSSTAKKLVDGHDVELWDGPRFVIGIKSGDDT